MNNKMVVIKVYSYNPRGKNNGQLFEHRLSPGETMRVPGEGFLFEGPVQLSWEVSILPGVETTIAEKEELLKLRELTKKQRKLLREIRKTTRIG